jgi:gliding motility-associated-like protein
MKKIYFLFSLPLFFIYSNLNSQTVFWTEDFGSGCAHTSFTTTNGAWVENTTVGVNGADKNEWYISAQENGNAAGACGSGCGTDKSLHVGSSANVAGDGGAAYLNGGFGFFFPETHSRIESPVINCTGQNTITLNFNYIEFGDGTNDDAEVMYFDGVTWAPLFNMPKTTCCGGPCNGSLQALWTAFSIALPASANNNANVKIGFYWQNNDDGVGTDPSFAVDDITLTVPGGAAPVPSFTLTTPVCAGTSVALNGTATNSPTTWAWSTNPATGVTIAAPASQNTTATFTTAGTYTVTLAVTNGSGSNSTTQIIVVNTEPTVTVTPNPATICSGTSTNLTASGATNYTWSPATALTCTNCPVTTANPTVTTTYTVVGVTGTCDDTVSVTVNVTSAITASATATPTVVCAGGSTTLNATGGTTYTWTADPSLSCTNCASPTASPTVNTVYTVTVGSGSCPTATATISVSVTSSVTATATAANSTICSGSSTTLNSTGGTAVWSPGTGLSCTNCTSPTASPTVTTTYTVSVTNGTCPAATASVTVNVTPATVASANSSSSIICNGQSSNLTATGGGTYSWAPGATLSCTTCANPVATPTATTTYTVTVTNGTCPSATATVVITVNTCVQPVANFTNNLDSVCTGECINFTSTSTGSPTSTTWIFQNGSPSSANTPSVTVCYYTPGTYSVALIVQNANGADTMTTTVDINPLPVANVFPGVDTVIYGTSAVLLATSGQTTYLWTPNTGVSCVACSLTTVTPVVDTWYTCQMTNQYGCSSSDSAFVIVDIICGEVFVPNAFSPNNDLSNDVLKVRGNCLTSINFIVYDRWGDKVFESTDVSLGWDGTFKGKAMDTAVFYYYLTAKTADGKTHEKKGNITLIR